jgi:hypothetical protein
MIRLNGQGGQGPDLSDESMYGGYGYSRRNYVMQQWIAQPAMQVNQEESGVAAAAAEPSGSTLQFQVNAVFGLNKK